MFFPTTPVLDNFNRPDEGPPPSSNWADIGGIDGFEVISNQCVASANLTTNVSYWNVTTFLNPEVYVTIPVIADENSGLIARLDVATLNGYSVFLDTSLDEITLNRLDGGADTVLGAAFSQSINDGDSFGIRIIDSILELWYKVGAGAWTLLGTRTDATYTASGASALFGEDTILRFDNFGGGEFERHGLLLGQYRNRLINL